MAIRVVAKFAQSIVLFSLLFYEFQKILDISFHTKTLQFPLRRISSVNYRLIHATDHITIRL